MLKPALLFGDGAVLQRDKRIPIWGTAAPHAPVSISIQGQTARTTANEKGEWLAYCGPLRTSRAEEVCIRSGDEQLLLREVAVGEVWIAGGHRSMYIRIVCMTHRWCMSQSFRKSRTESMRHLCISII